MPLRSLLKAGAGRRGDDVRLGAAIEAANFVIDAPAKGIGKPGMAPLPAVLIEGNQRLLPMLATRIYLLHHGTLVRITTTTC